MAALYWAALVLGPPTATTAGYTLARALGIARLERRR